MRIVGALVGCVLVAGAAVAEVPKPIRITCASATASVLPQGTSASIEKVTANEMVVADSVKEIERLIPLGVVPMDAIIKKFTLFGDAQLQSYKRALARADTKEANAIFLSALGEVLDSAADLTMEVRVFGELATYKSMCVWNSLGDVGVTTPLASE